MTIITAKTLRANLPTVVERVRKGDRYTVLYRSRPAFRIVPVEGDEQAPSKLEDDTLYRADAVGASTDGKASTDHDATLYGR
jgi:prevent-host-death family protein